MSDPASVLADHLWAGNRLDRWGTYHWKCACGWETTEESARFRAHTAHQLDMLSEQGYAVVKLPDSGLRRMAALKLAARMRKQSTVAADLPWSKLTDAQKLPWLLQACRATSTTEATS